MNGSQNKSQERIGKEFCLHRGSSEIAQAKIRSGPWPGYFTTCYGLSSLRSLAQKNRRPQNILRKRRPCYDRSFRMWRQMAGWGGVSRRDHNRFFSLCHYFAITKALQGMNPDTWEETNGKIERQERITRNQKAFGHSRTGIWAKTSCCR